jgi:hypothetical protein
MTKIHYFILAVAALFGYLCWKKTHAIAAVAASAPAKAATPQPVSPTLPPLQATPATPTQADQSTMGQPSYGQAYYDLLPLTATYEP